MGILSYRQGELVNDNMFQSVFQRRETF